MLAQKSFVKKTKKGQVVKVVREHYLRDDIHSGSPLDAECPPEGAKLSATASHYVVLDTNVALHQMDLLEHAAVDDVVVCSVVLEEVKAKNLSIYQRLRALCANDARRFFVFANEHHRRVAAAAAAAAAAAFHAPRPAADRGRGRLVVIFGGASPCVPLPAAEPQPPRRPPPPAPAR